LFVQSKAPRAGEYSTCDPDPTALSEHGGRELDKKLLVRCGDLSPRSDARSCLARRRRHVTRPNKFAAAGEGRQSDGCLPGEDHGGERTKWLTGRGALSFFLSFFVEDIAEFSSPSRACVTEKKTEHSVRSNAQYC
jgi:hypothetical protein